jgi:hypothetical protein
VANRFREPIMTPHRFFRLATAAMLILACGAGNPGSGERGARSWERRNDRGSQLRAPSSLLNKDSRRHTKTHQSHTADANDLTKRYGSSRFSKWQIRGAAIGRDDSVLCISIGIVLDDSMIEALHYGSGLYDVYPGGIQGFMRDRHFRAVAYTDKTGRKWSYGVILPGESRCP